MGDTPQRPKRQSGYDRGDLTWCPCPDGTYALHAVGIAGAIVHVVPDAKHAELWRIAYPDGHLSDFANLPRAKDTAAAVALGILNRRLEREAA
jgi:hypothetical protein